MSDAIGIFHRQGVFFFAVREHNAALSNAKEKQPRFADDFENAYLSVLSESLEWQSQAMLVPRGNYRVNARSLASAEEESMHCIVTHIRFLLREYNPQ